MSRIFTKCGQELNGKGWFVGQEGKQMQYGFALERLACDTWMNSKLIKDILPTKEGC